jgi:N-acetylglutamate synthase-like GNAT family acetyltransferase
MLNDIVCMHVIDTLGLTGNISEQLSEEKAEEIYNMIIDNWILANKREHCYTEQRVVEYCCVFTPKSILEESLKESQIYFTNKDDEVIGFCSIAKDNDGYELKRLNVRDDYQGQGLGSFITNLRMNILKEYGIKEVYIDSMLFPSTIRFHEKNGFTRSMNESRYEEYAVRMTKSL